MNILAEIVEKLKPRLEERKRALPMEALSERAAQAPARPKFADAFRGDGMHIIAELKKASPSKGLIRNDLNVKSLATELAANGAAAKSAFWSSDASRRPPKTYWLVDIPLRVEALSSV